MATRTISTKLAVEGEAAYKQAIAACNSELTTLKSGLALVESEFRNNANSMETLVSKGTALDSMYKKHQEKVTTLEAALKNAYRAQEEYAARVSTSKENIECCEKALEDSASVSDIVTDVLTAFGLAASDSAHFVDVLAAASSNSNANVSMMGETFKYAAPVAGALGYFIEDTCIQIGRK